VGLGAGRGSAHTTSAGTFIGVAHWRGSWLTTQSSGRKPAARVRAADFGRYVARGEVFASLYL
jgi:hypothetical protein